MSISNYGKLLINYYSLLVTGNLGKFIIFVDVKIISQMKYIVK